MKKLGYSWGLEHWQMIDMDVVVVDMAMRWVVHVSKIE